MGNHGNGYQKTYTCTHMKSNADANAVQKTMEGQTRSAKNTYRRMLVLNIVLSEAVIRKASGKISKKQTPKSTPAVKLVM